MSYLTFCLEDNIVYYKY